uniref:Uncharacterized protein n=1 Tax=Lactuca sativa TaxID=4236 RepID=A0A9R1UKX3_LACSA|nr:hypothetical protein LSAT_V11C900490380 [Lactuca sativa]
MNLITFKLSNFLFEVVKSLQYPPVSERNPSNVLDHPVSEISYESVSTTFRYDVVASTGLPSTRARPSFLNSILPNEETDKANNPFSSKVHPVDAPPITQRVLAEEAEKIASTIDYDKLSDIGSEYEG